VEDFLSDVLIWMRSLPPGWIYATIFAVAYLENVVPPIPGDMVIVFGGYLVGLGYVGFLSVAILATAGGALGFMTMYAVGWKVGGAVFDVRRLRWIPKRPAWRARAWVLRYGFAVVAANRFLSGLRSVISLAVGAARMNPVSTAGWATLSAGAWSLLIIYLGYLVGDRWTEIGEYLELYGRSVLLVAVGGLVTYLLYRIWRRWRGDEGRRSGEDPFEGLPEEFRH
jgi:membrane protein DedA with SNARE-associated domain